MVKLTDKQKMFIDEYLVDLNATQAAIRAGYSKKTARQIGQSNLSKVDIKSAIDERLREKEERLIMKQDEILKLYTEIARGELDSATLIGTGQGAQDVTSMKPTAVEKLRALDSLAKINAMFIDKQEIEHSGAVQFVDDIDD